MMWMKGGKRSLPFLLAICCSGGRRFKVSSIRYNFNKAMIVCLVELMPRSYLEQ